MGIILFLIGILLFGTTVWLRRLITEQIHDFTLSTVLLPSQKVSASLIPPKPNPIKVWYRRVVAFLWKKLVAIPWLLVIEVVLIISGISASIFLFTKGQVWLALIILGATVTYLAYFLFRIRFKFFILLSSLFPPRYNRIVIETPSNEIIVNGDPNRILAILGGLAWVEYAGKATIPTKMYVGDSENIAVELKAKLILDTSPDIEQGFHVEDKDGIKVITLQVRRNPTVEEFLEIELLAAGLTVDGEKKQRQLLSLKSTQNLSYQWSCYFPNSGNQAVTLVFRFICSSDVVQLGAIHHSIRVAQLDHLTQRQVRMMVAFAGIAGFISTVIGIVLNVPGLLHLFGLR